MWNKTEGEGYTKYEFKTPNLIFYATIEAWDKRVDYFTWEVWCGQRTFAGTCENFDDAECQVIESLTKISKEFNDSVYQFLAGVGKGNEE